MRMYALDHDYLNVVAWRPVAGSGPLARQSWRLALLPYIKNRGIYTCTDAPADDGFARGFRRAPFSAECDDDGMAVLSGGYGINTVHRQPGRPDPPGWAGRPAPKPVSADEIAEPSNLIFACDSGPDTYEVTSWSNAPGFRYSAPAATRHTGGSSYLFADGHVKWMKPESILCTKDECWWSVQGRH